jgi:mono/diheme cytochrome c family protein
MSIPSAIRLATGMALLGVAPPLAAQGTVPAPAGVDSASIAAGRVLYLGRGGCAPCHGEAAEGTAEGPSLTAGTTTLGRCAARRCSTLPRCGGWQPTCSPSVG